MSRRIHWVLPLEALILGVFRLPSDLRFDLFAFFDQGSELAVHSLMKRGLRPTIDFGYIYGLSPLFFGEIWYRIVGLQPSSFAVISIIGGGLMAWGIARVLAALELGWVALVWVIVTLPIGLIWAAPPSMTHVLEPIFLMHGFAELAAGRRNRALAFGVACIFVKPSMAFLFALAVLGLIVHRDKPATLAQWRKLLLPAATVGLGCALVLTLWFGPIVVFHSLVPLSGRAVYRANHYGFFWGSGRDFWMPARFRWNFYLETVAGLWLPSCVLLTLSALVQVLRASSKKAERTARDVFAGDVICVCAGLHLAFVALFFGNQWSWVYYFHFVVIGLAATSGQSRCGRIAVILLTIVALPSTERSLRGPFESWTERARSSDTWNLWASTVVRSEWIEVRRLTARLHPVLLATGDGASFLDPAFSPPEVSFLVRGHLQPVELERKRRQVAASNAVVVGNPAPGDPWFDEWPEFREALKNHVLAWSCPRIRVYLRAESKISSKKSR